MEKIYKLLNLKREETEDGWKDFATAKYRYFAEKETAEKILKNYVHDYKLESEQYLKTPMQDRPTRIWNTALFELENVCGEFRETISSYMGFYCEIDHIGIKDRETWGLD